MRFLFIAVLLSANAYIATAQEAPTPGKNTALPPPIKSTAGIELSVEGKKEPAGEPPTEIVVDEIQTTENKGEPVYALVQNPRHRQCLLDVQENVEEGRKAAERWMRDGGGPFATHCLAVADLAAGFPRLAAIRLLSLAEQESAGDALTRARLYAQASEILLVENRFEESADALATAFVLAPDAGELYLLAAKVNHATEKWQSVIDAITNAEDSGFYTSTGYASRARAYKNLTQFDHSAEDVVRALQIDPFNLDALVLRGELAQIGINIMTNFRKSTSANQTEISASQSTTPEKTSSAKPLILPEGPAAQPGEIDLAAPPPLEQE